ncbi:MAG: tetratricopeptide repeat-containing sensor histidine kinase [Chitinophagaceae bacterium]
MRRSIICIVILLAAACLRAQDGPGNLLNGKVSVDDYERIIKYYRYYKADSAVFFAAKGMELSRRLKDSTGIAKMLMQLGMIDDNNGAFDSAQQKYTTAFELFKQKGDRKGTAAAMIRLGVVDLRNGKYDDALKWFFSALDLSEKTGDRFGMMEANYSISWAHQDHKDFPKALQYLKKAEALNEQLPFSNISLNIFNHLGVVYRETGEPEKAKAYLQKGIKHSNRPEYYGLNITMINNLALVYASEGNKTRAIALQQQALKRSREIGNYLRELQSLLGLSKTYGKDHPAEAVFYVQQAVELARKKQLPRQEMRFLKVLADQYKEQGNFEAALQAKEREHALADTFLYKTVSRNMASLKAEYELSKSNARIKELDLENKQRRMELQGARDLRRFTLAGIVLLLFVLSLLYNQYRIKKRNSRELNLKNQSLERLLDEKEWLLKEVHHRVKNNLQTITSLLESQSAYLKDDALVAVRNSQHRVYAMSLIHQKLYQMEASGLIDLSAFVPELLSYLSDSFDIEGRIVFHKAIEGVKLDISQAVPVALVMNEAITNSIKYAFPDNRPGKVDVVVRQEPGERIVVMVKDDGVGLPEGWGNGHENSLGIKLMKGLSEDIQAFFSMESSSGTCVSMVFRKAPIGDASGIAKV